MYPLSIPVGPFVFRAREAGPKDGPLVLLLHGFPQSSAEWKSQLEALGAAGYHAVAPDQRGYSPGARPEGVDAYAVAALVADTLGMADALGAETFHLVGHDWGAIVAWHVAARHPKRLRTLTIVSRFRFISSGGRPRRPSFPPRATIRMRTSPSSDQSRRLRPPAVVSPDTPALTTSNR